MDWKIRNDINMGCQRKFQYGAEFTFCLSLSNPQMRHMAKYNGADWPMTAVNHKSGSVNLSIISSVSRSVSQFLSHTMRQPLNHFKVCLADLTYPKPPYTHYIYTGANECEKQKCFQLFLTFVFTLNQKTLFHENIKRMNKESLLFCLVRGRALSCHAHPAVSWVAKQ